MEPMIIDPLIVLLDNEHSRRDSWRLAFEDEGFEVQPIATLPQPDFRLPDRPVTVICHIGNFFRSPEAYDGFFRAVSRAKPVVFSGGGLRLRKAADGGDELVTDDDRALKRVPGQLVVLRRLNSADGDIVAHALKRHWPSRDPDGFLQAIQRKAWPKATLSLYLGALLLNQSTDEGLPQETRDRILALEWGPVLNESFVEAGALGIKPHCCSTLSEDNAATLRSWARAVLKAAGSL